MRLSLLTIGLAAPMLLLSPMASAYEPGPDPRIKDITRNTFGVLVEVLNAYEVEAVLVRDEAGDLPALVEQIHSKPGREEWKYEFQYRKGFAEGAGKFRLTIHAGNERGETITRNFKIEL